MCLWETRPDPKASKAEPAGGSAVVNATATKGAENAPVDRVILGDTASERSHDFHGEKTKAGQFQGRAWRDASDGGWFSFRMRVLPDDPVALRCVYWGGRVDRISDFFCNEKRFASQIENFDRINQFWTAEYPIPQAWTANQREVTLKLQTRPGKVGGVFAWEIVRRDAASDASPKHAGLRASPQFVRLPVGAIRPTGWLKRQLEIQAQGLTGYADEFVFTNSQWKGGCGNRLIGPPYRYMSNYLEGLVPLAWLLDDARLKSKSKPYIEWLLASGRTDGWFGPPRQDDNEEKVTNNPEYLACALKMLIEYSEVSGDNRVLPLAEKYLQYVDRHVEVWRREFWWGNRAMEHAIIAHWVYQKTNNPEYLNILDRIQKRSGYSWSAFFAEFPWDDTAVAQRRIPLGYDALGKTAHGVALAWAVKFPALAYLHTGEEADRVGSLRALAVLDRYHGQAAGRFSCDELVSGQRPTQGTELCTVMELAYSLEKVLEILGDVSVADRLETLVYNAIPGTTTPDFWAHQYNQQANQVLVSAEPRAWINNGPESNLYGLYPQYPCCLGNMHQGWPRFVEHLWMGTRDEGLAAVAFGPSQVSFRRAGVLVTVREETEYPFNGTIRFVIQTPQTLRFPFSIRIPTWAAHATLKVGDEQMSPAAGTWARMDRTWNSGDEVRLTLPMEIRRETRYQQASAVLRGPLYYSLRIDKKYHMLKSHGFKGAADWEIRPTTPWNYALEIDPNNPSKGVEMVRHPIGPFPFGDRDDKVYTAEAGSTTDYGRDAPVVLKIPARRIAPWRMSNGSAADPPPSPVTSDAAREIVELVPYGCARLRITEFPTVSPRNESRKGEH